MKPIALIFIVGIGVLSACNKGSGIPPKTLTPPEWEALVGMVPPVGSQLIAQGKVEDVNIYGITSSDPIAMPLYDATGVKEYLALPIENTKAYVESVLDVHIESPRGALSSEWRVGQYLYRGTVLRAGNGDYMVIEKYPE